MMIAQASRKDSACNGIPKLLVLSSFRHVAGDNAPLGTEEGFMVDPVTMSAPSLKGSWKAGPTNPKTWPCRNGSKVLDSS